VKTTLTGEDSFLDADRSSYTFRAKSITGAVDGAKMDVALPVDTLDDINNIWENDSFSAVFRSKIITGFNLNLNKLIDTNDDAAKPKQIEYQTGRLSGGSLSLNMLRRIRCQSDRRIASLASVVGVGTAICVL
jgi:hypothetical protein